MPDMKREQDVCMSDSSNNNACTCSYTGSFGNEYFGANASSETGSPSNSYKNAIAFSSKSNTLVSHSENVVPSYIWVLQCSIFGMVSDLFRMWSSLIPRHSHF